MVMLQQLQLIKFLYVGNEWTVSKNYKAPVSETKTVDWECFVDPALNYTTTVKYMSTQVYPNIGSELGLNALSTTKVLICHASEKLRQ